MAAQISTPTPRTIRVYCPSHRVGFSTAATATIECPNQTHTLARNFPSEGLWEYCCDCQHYWPIEGGKGSEECPVCERHIDRRFLCSHCDVVSIESNNSAKRKLFSISAQGTVAPSCPGCLNPAGARRLDHACADFAGAFVTARDTCPFCGEQVEPPSGFPCSVETYLAKLPHSAKLVVFDQDSVVLKESNQGNFFLIPVKGDSARAMVIPNSARLSSKQDYYNFYYEVFNCENPVPGEVIIAKPALVEAVEGGWRLSDAGLIEIKPDVAASSEQLSAPPSPVIEKQAEAAPFIPVETLPKYQPPETYPPVPVSGGLQPKTIYQVVGGIALFGIVLTIIAVVSTNNNVVEKKLDSAITSGRLFAPPGDNARDLYYQLKNSGANEEKLKRYREKLLPLITNPYFQMIGDFMVPGSDDLPLPDWQNAQQAMQWAVELKPGDSVLLARSLYCEGRIAYLLKDENRAIEIWTRAAEADKSWPLPVNGIGLIYTARRNYPVARTYYFEAARRDPSWAYPYNNIGTSYYMERNYYEAKTYYQKAAQVAPQWARPHSWLGDIAMKEKDYYTAIQEFSLVLESGATGTKNMDLEKIRRQLEFARQQQSAY